MRQLDPGKTALVALTLLNVVFFFYNGWTTWQRTEATDVEIAQNRAVQLKRDVEAFRADLRRISEGNIIQVKRASEHFATQASLAGLSVLQQLQIPQTPKDGNLAGFGEETWKIGFTRDTKLTLKQMADFANRIERTAPGFQIKEFDAGERSKEWGRDEWKPSHITVRRIYRKRTN